MSRLPKAGDAQAAAEVLDRRLKASTNNDDGVAVAEVNVRTGEMRGESGVMRAAFGDLFDIAELAEIAVGPVRSFLADICGGVDPESAMLSMYLLAAAHGCMMERARWTK